MKVWCEATPLCNLIGQLDFYLTVFLSKLLRTNLLLDGDFYWQQNVFDIFNVNYDSAYLIVINGNLRLIWHLVIFRKINKWRKEITKILLHQNMFFLFPKTMTFWSHFQMLIVDCFAKKFFWQSVLVRNDLERFSVILALAMCSWLAEVMMLRHLKSRY